MDASQQCQRFRIGAEQQVLAVVDRQAGALDAPRPSAGNRAGLEQRDLDAGVGQRDGGRAAGPAGADDRDRAAAVHDRREVFQAIHSLRNGVSDVRWSSTW